MALCLSEADPGIPATWATPGNKNATKKSHGVRSVRLRGANRFGIRLSLELGQASS
ncbi:hypothetical protein DESC_590028 [Desulfosarcina cetonica]|nr:hypothetical protein DESC_590028 [Desulfosarcina cetonica]